MPLQIEHIHPCNQKKGAQDVKDFLSKDKMRLDRILVQAKKPHQGCLRRQCWALFNAFKTTELQVRTESGGLTKFNRLRLTIPKTYALGAVCIGATDAVSDWQKPTLAIKATGCGSYQRTRLDAFDFPRSYLIRH